MRVAYIQVNNDYSGSAFALSSIIMEHNISDCVLLTDFQTNGFLSTIEMVKKIHVPYKFLGKDMRTILQLFRNWAFGTILFLREHYRTPFDVVYLNTISPWNIAMFSKILNIHVVYHVHEHYIRPNILTRLYLFIMSRTADELVFVSEDCAKRYKQIIDANNMPYQIQYTPIRYKAVKPLELDINRKMLGAIIMIGAPKKYKGVEQFLNIAKVQPKTKFKLFLSGEYIFNENIPINMEVIVGKVDLIEELKAAKILLSLTRHSEIIETFGLTIWEGMSQGTPVIVPHVGGPAEIVTLESGVCVNVEDTNEILAAIQSITLSKEGYQNYCEGAARQAKRLEMRYPILRPKIKR